MYPLSSFGLTGRGDALTDSFSSVSLFKAASRASRDALLLSAPLSTGAGELLILELRLRGELRVPVATFAGKAERAVVPPRTPEMVDDGGGEGEVDEAIRRDIGVLAVADGVAIVLGGVGGRADQCEWEALCTSSSRRTKARDERWPR